jgi:hypothetical protein
MGFSFSGASVDGNVIHVDGYAPSIDKVLEDSIHHGLEGGRRVGESEEHYSGLEESFIRYEGRFPSILLFNENFIIPPFNIEPCEYGGSSQAVNELGNKRRGIAIFNCSSIHCSVVLDWSEFSIFLLYEEERYGIGAFQ